MGTVPFQRQQKTKHLCFLGNRLFCEYVTWKQTHAQMCLIAAIIGCPKNTPEQCVITRSTHGSLHCSISRHSKSSRLAVSSLHAWQPLLLTTQPLQESNEGIWSYPSPWNRMLLTRCSASQIILICFCLQKKTCTPTQSAKPLVFSPLWAPSVAYSQEKQL